MSTVNIAIDGPSGAGKSTLAKKIAKALGIYYLDTGSMYRAVAYAAIQSGVDIGNKEQVERLIEHVDLKTVYQNGEQQVLLSGQNVMPYIRTPEISKAASDISAYPCVRFKLVKMQRDVADQYDVVLDGRDIGTYVLPDAKHKFFLTADVKERAKRRFLELSEKSIDTQYSDVLRDMKVRDDNDSSRNFAPLKQADDAMLIDTTNLSIEDVLDVVLSKFRQE
ncbi:MAG: (d)CMP kinase [Christensenellales bacterium]|jgi:cytidylate kinase